MANRSRRLLPDNPNDKGQIVERGLRLPMTALRRWSHGGKLEEDKIREMNRK